MREQKNTPHAVVDPSSSNAIGAKLPNGVSGRDAQSQPLGFYSPSQLVQDARRHHVVVRPADVIHGNVDCTLEDLPHEPAVRLGLRLIRHLKAESADRIVSARAERAFDSAEDLARRAGLEQHEMKLLAAGDALMSLSGHRRQQVWDAAPLRSTPLLLRDAPIEEDYLELPAAPEGEGEEIVFDHASLGMSLRRHPLALLRPRLDAHRLLTAEQLDGVPNGRPVRYCGIVTSNGIVILETGKPLLATRLAGNGRFRKWAGWRRCPSLG